MAESSSDDETSNIDWNNKTGVVRTKDLVHKCHSDPGKVQAQRQCRQVVAPRKCLLTLDGYSYVIGKNLRWTQPTSLCPNNGNHFSLFLVFFLLSSFHCLVLCHWTGYRLILFSVFIVWCAKKITELELVSKNEEYTKSPTYAKDIWIEIENKKRFN